MQRTFLHRLALRLPFAPSFIGELSQLRAEGNRLRVERDILRAELDSLRGLPVAPPSAEPGTAPGPPPVAGEANRLRVERDILRAELDSLRRLTVDPPSGEMGSDGSPRPAPVPPPVASEGLLFKDWVREQVRAEPYFFQKIALGPDIVTPGWSDPAKEKLPYYGLPGDLTGARVLDIGCAEGFFSFEAERRGAREVVAIDSFPDSIRRFSLCRAALGSRATAYLANVYELSPSTFGTFDWSSSTASSTTCGIPTWRSRRSAPSARARCSSRHWSATRPRCSTCPWASSTRTGC